jgi:glycosyltransferase involved in cell wall biosynthesis
MLVDAVAVRTGGGPVRLRELATALPALRPDAEFTFVVPEDGVRAVRRLAPDVKTVCPPRGMGHTPARLVWEHLVMPGLNRDAALDVALSPFNVLPTRWPGRTPVRAVIVSNLAPYAPEVRSMYGGRPGMRLEVLRRLTDRTLQRADRVFLLSRQAYDLIGRSILGDRAELIPMAPPPIPEVLPVPARLPEDPFFFSSSDFARYKGLEVAIEALARVRVADPPLLLVAGRELEPDYASAMRDLAVHLGVADRVWFIGPTGHEEVLALMRRSVACVTPSRFENPGRVPVEAMAMSAPVLSADVPASREVCADAAWYFSLSRPDELAAMMKDLLERPALRDPMIEAGRARVRGMTPSSAAEQILASVETIVQDRPARPRAATRG